MNWFYRLPLARWSLTRPEAALALLVIGTRLSVFSYAGSPLPYYDQWLAEFNNLFIGIFTGQNFKALIDFHNEHCLFTTKLLSLLGFLANGYWDLKFLIICSALVRATTAVWTLRLVTQTASLPLQRSLWLLCIVFFAVPVSGYNLLSGLQVSFFLADGALLWSLHILSRWEKKSHGLALIGSMAFGVASMGSALTIPAATLLAHLSQKRARPGFWLAWSVTVLLALVYTKAVISTQAVATNPAGQSLWSAPHFWLQILAWPTNLAGVGAFVLGASVFFLLRIRRRDWATDAPWAVLVGLGVYGATNAALIAAARPIGSLHMRQWDTISWVAFAILATGLHAGFQAKWSRPAWLFFGIASLGYGLGLGLIFRTVTIPYLQAAHQTRAAAVVHYRALLLQGDLHAEAVRVNRLLQKNDTSFFDEPLGRHNLHPIVLLNLSNAHRRPLTLLAPEIIPTRPSSFLSRLLQVVIDWAWLLGVSALLLDGTAWHHSRKQL